MGRRIRYIPPESLVEVTCRTVQGRCLLRPTPLIADLTRGVLARAARLYPVEIHAFIFLGNHYHLLMAAPNADRLAAFMNYLNSNLAREVGRAVHWREKFWGRRYQAILVSGEEAAQVDRLRYLLRHGCKEGLVRRPGDWPGATSLPAMVSGTPVAGKWLDRTAEHKAAKRRRSLDPGRFVASEILQLAPLPCWRHLTAENYAARICELVRRIEAETERWILESGRQPLGRERLLRQHPHSRPSRNEKRPAPLVHAASRALRLAFRRGYREFVVAFRHASTKLRLGHDPTSALLLFPLGSFPARPAFVTTGPRL